MNFDPNKLEQADIYKLLTGSIIPRPIGWVSTVDENGINNLAGKNGQIDHQFPEQIDHQFRFKLTTKIRFKLTTK